MPALSNITAFSLPRRTVECKASEAEAEAEAGAWGGVVGGAES